MRGRSASTVSMVSDVTEMVCDIGRSITCTDTVRPRARRPHTPHIAGPERAPRSFLGGLTRRLHEQYAMRSARGIEKVCVWMRRAAHEGRVRLADRRGEGVASAPVVRVAPALRGEPSLGDGPRRGEPGPGAAPAPGRSGDHQRPNAPCSTAAAAHLRLAAVAGLNRPAARVGGSWHPFTVSRSERPTLARRIH